MPSVNRKPAANSKSWPGVRMVMETVRSPSLISSGSSMASRSCSGADEVPSIFWTGTVRMLRFTPIYRTAWNWMRTALPSSGQIVAIQIHHLGPRRSEVPHEHVFRIVRCIDFRKRSKLRVRTEHQVHARAGPLDVTRLAIAALEHAFVRGRLPLGAH